MTLVDVITHFDTDERCRELLVRLRWPNGVECPRCKMPAVDLATAKQFGINLVTVVVNNASYGNVKRDQERLYEGRHSGAVLHNPRARRVVAQVLAMLLYLLWVVAVNGAIPPQVLASESGTSLTPLARELGITVKILGAIFVILARKRELSVPITRSIQNRSWC